MDNAIERVRKVLGSEGEPSIMEGVERLRLVRSGKQNAA